MYRAKQRIKEQYNRKTAAKNLCGVLSTDTQAASPPAFSVQRK